LHNSRKVIQKGKYFEIFLKSCLDLMKYEESLNALRWMIAQCTQDKEIPMTYRPVNQVLRKKRTNKEFRLSAQVGEYDMDNVILDLGSYVNFIPIQMWEMMGKPKLVWSIVQLRFRN
jgi:hypothetical protein